MPQKIQIKTVKVFLYIEILIVCESKNFLIEF